MHSLRSVWQDIPQKLSGFRALQPSTFGVLYEESLVRLVEYGHLSIAAACGCVRSAYTSPRASLAATDLHTAAFLCSSLVFLSARSQQLDAGIDTSHLQRLYADCEVSLATLIPEVSRSH